MRNRLGLVIVALAVAVTVVVIVFSFRATRPMPPPTEPTTAQQMGGERTSTQPTSLHIQGTEVTQRDKETGKIIWQARAAGRFDFDDVAQTLRANDIHWELVRAGQEKLVIEAPKFLAHYKDRQINFADGVRVYTESKSQLFEVSSLVYEFDTQKLIGKGPVSFRLGKYRVTGDRLVIDNRREEVRITGPGRFSRLAGS